MKLTSGAEVGQYELGKTTPHPNSRSLLQSAGPSDHHLNVTWGVPSFLHLSGKAIMTTKKFKELDVVREGKFHIYPISTIDEGIEAGECHGADDYPEHTVNHVIQARPRGLAEKVQSFTRNSNHSEPDKEKEISL